MVCFVLSFWYVYLVVAYSVDTYQFGFGVFLGMIFLIFVQNVVFCILPHLRDLGGNSATQKFWDFSINLCDIHFHNSLTLTR